jgi:disulfide bond formation protein DsbB
MELAPSINFVFGVLAIIADVAVVCFVGSWLFGFKIPEVILKRGLFIAFVAALLATLGSLTYSEILGYAPCKLCWIQRIFMYPQVLVLGLALWGKHKENRALLDLSLLMSIIGGVAALYHYLMQLGFIPEGSCAAIGYSASCAERFVLQFGYITIPFMALSAFALIALALSLARSRNSASQ